MEKKDRYARVVKRHFSESHDLISDHWRIKIIIMKKFLAFVLYLHAKQNKPEKKIKKAFPFPFFYFLLHSTDHELLINMLYLAANLTCRQHSLVLSYQKRGGFFSKETEKYEYFLNTNLFKRWRVVKFHLSGQQVLQSYPKNLVTIDFSFEY